MNRLRLLPLLVFATLATLATLATAAAPPAAESPGGVEVLEAIPFRCAEPWTHHWSAERPEVEAGTIVVARVDPAALRPRAAASPLLMVGEEIAEIVNPGNADGIVIAIVPAPAGWTAGTTPSLAGREVFLSEPALADQVDAAGRKSRRDAARVAGVPPQPASPRTAPRTALRSLADRDALDRELAGIVRRRCPDQSRLADLLDGSIGSQSARPVGPATAD